MSTLDYPKSDKRSFFSIYKPGQGKYVRWGTVIGMAIIILTGMYWLGFQTQIAAADFVIKTSAMAAWVVLGAFLTFWMVNTPRFTEFLIMTESEMRKVTWPNRREVIISTKVVIVLTILLGIILWIVDILFMQFFAWIGIS